MKPLFDLPPKGIMVANGPDDPLRYYYHPLAGFLYRARAKQALSLLRPPYESILELGYGSGILIPSLVSFGQNVSGLDRDSDPEKVMRNLGKIGVSANLMQGDICKMTYPQDSFDLVVAISLFEHINEIGAVISNVFRILRPGGHFLAGMPQVNKFMKFAFPLIGYYDIGKQHITNCCDFLRVANSLFKLVSLKQIPRYFPKVFGLYFNMLFVKQKS